MKTAILLFVVTFASSSMGMGVPKDMKDMIDYYNLYATCFGQQAMAEYMIGIKEATKVCMNIPSPLGLLEELAQLENDVEGESLDELLKNNPVFNKILGRERRQIDNGLIDEEDLDKLKSSIADQKNKMLSKIGNLTCVLAQLIQAKAEKMMKSILALALAASASAFVAPRSAMKPATIVKADFSNELGAIPPVGFFDPAGLSKNIDQDTFDRYRFLEIKHGRICQLAVLGYLFPEFCRFPGDIAPGVPFASVPHGIAALEAIPSLGWIQMIFFIGSVDYWGFFGDFEVGKVGGEIKQGGILDLNEEEFAARQTQEIQHGRLGMLAFMELLRHDIGNYFDGADPGHFIIGLPGPY